jgi:hypothetical protein
MSSSGMLCRVAVVRTDVSEEHIASINRVIKSRRARKYVLRLLVTANVVPSSPSLVTLKMEPQILHSINRLGFIAET